MYGTYVWVGGTMAYAWIGNRVYVTDTDCVCADCGMEYREFAIKTVDGKDYCETCYGERFTTCEGCGAVIPRDDAQTVDGEDYCEDCYGERFTTCAACENVISQDDAQSVDGEDYCEDCYRERFTTCASCGTVISQDDSRTSESGEDYCETCYDENFIHCDDCGCELDRESAYCNDDGAYCEGCYPGDEENGGAEWEMGDFAPSRVYREMKSHRKYGVELETSSCPDHGSLEGRTLFGCKPDGSIKGQEFVSPALSSDKGLGVIRDFCRLAERNGFKVDKDCGFHAHFDISREPAANLKSIIVAYHLTYALWASFVPPDRRRNHYCKCHDWQPSEFDDVLTQSDFRGKACAIDRYQWCNVSAYYRHGTVEIRLHSATLDPEKICNWVKAHARFIDWAVKHTPWEIRNRFQGSPSEQFQALAEIWDDTGLADYYRRRAEKFGTVYHALQVA